MNVSLLYTTQSDKQRNHCDYSTILLKNNMQPIQVITMTNYEHIERYRKDENIGAINVEHTMSGRTGKVSFETRKYLVVFLRFFSFQNLFHFH